MTIVFDITENLNEIILYKLRKNVIHYTLESSDAINI